MRDGVIFDYRMEGEGFDEGYQSVPVNWGISSERKKGFLWAAEEDDGGDGLITGLVALGLVAVPQELERFAYVELHMGGDVSIQLYAPSREVADRAARAAYARFEDLEQKMSDYRETSEIRVAQEAAVGEVGAGFGGFVSGFEAREADFLAYERGV